MIDYWIEVHELLVQNYGFDLTQASDIIKVFRLRLQKDDIEDAIYHRDPEFVAESLSTAKLDDFTDDLC